MQRTQRLNTIWWIWSHNAMGWMLSFGKTVQQLTMQTIPFSF